MDLPVPSRALNGCRIDVRPVSCLRLWIIEDEHHGHRMADPVINVPVIRSENVCSRRHFLEKTCARFYLQGYKLSGRSRFINDLNMGVDSIVVCRLFSEQPAQPGE